MSTRLGIRASVGVAVVAIAVGFAGYAYGQDPQVNQTYTGCLSRGVLTNVAIGDAPLSACKGTQTQISWNQTGPPGPQGAAASLADTECPRAGGDVGSLVTRVRRDNTVELSCESESGHQSLPLTEEVAQAAADLLLSGDRDLELPQHCDAFASAGCTGGQPVSPGPQVAMIGLDVFVSEVAHASRFDVSHALVLVKTQQPVQFRFQGTDCSLTIDSSYMPVRVPLHFVNHEDPTSASNRITLGDFQLFDFTESDFELSGGLFCSLATDEPVTVAAVRSAIVDGITGQMKDDLCGAPGPDLFMPCTQS